MPGIVAGFKKKTKLQIVWRNSNKPCGRRRRHSFDCLGEPAQYIVQESECRWSTENWRTIGSLEVTPGGRAENSPRNSQGSSQRGSQRRPQPSFDPRVIEDIVLLAPDPDAMPSMGWWDL